MNMGKKEVYEFSVFATVYTVIVSILDPDLQCGNLIKTNEF